MASMQAVTEQRPHMYIQYVLDPPPRDWSLCDSKAA